MDAEDATWPALKTEEGATSQRMRVALEAGKGREVDRGPLEEAPCYTVSILDLEDTNICVVLSP